MDTFPKNYDLLKAENYLRLVEHCRQWFYVFLGPPCLVGK